MKELIKYFLLSIIIAIQVQAQDKDSLIELNSGLGDTIDQFDRNYFELFKDIEGFNSAEFYIRNDDKLISKVSYLKNEDLKDTVIVQPLSKLESIRTRIGVIDWQNNKRLDYSEEFVLMKNDSSIYEGELLMFSRTHLYFDSDIDYINDEYGGSKFKVPIDSVKKLILPGSTAWSSVGWGAGIGLLIGIGVLAGSSSSGSSNIVSSEAVGAASMLILGLVGGLIGLAVGIVSESEDVVFEINSLNDLLQLKKYAKYYYQYDQSAEDEYVEIK